MGSTRRRFTDEYKAQAVAFGIDDQRPVAEFARNIGVHEMTLGRWVYRVEPSPDDILGVVRAPLLGGAREEPPHDLGVADL